MWTDVIDLRDFYRSGRGRVARRMVCRRIHEIWPDVKKMSVLGLGFATPYLDGFQEQSTRTFAAMPQGQGVLGQPQPGHNVLVDELELPFADCSMDRVLLVHALECSEQVRPMLREIWRVLTDSGRLLVIAPNRRGLWARFERTPFGHGQPYSSGQLSRLLRDNLFTPVVTERALYMPPVSSGVLLSAAPAIETLGSCVFKSFAGVVMAEATKQIYALSGDGQKSATRRYIRLPEHTGTGPASRNAEIRKDVKTL